MDITLIVAADDKDGIAKDGRIPWHIAPDLKRFKALTTGPGPAPCAVLMGRTTWDSLPAKVRPLPGRKNLVLSRTRQAFEGATCVSSWQEALDAAVGCGALWVIGGAAVYALALAEPETSAIELTRVDGDFDCDLRWGGVPEGYRLASVERLDGYRFERWVHPAR
jgi:dihydrofolate reductase